MQSVMLKARGLYTYPNLLSEIPEGALTVADNVVIDRNGVIEPRRGLAQYGDTFGNSEDSAKQLMVYKDRILRHFETTIQFDDGTGTFTDFNGTFVETETGLRIKSVEANGNFYFTTASGVKRISATNASEFTGAAGYIRNAGGVSALDVNGITLYTTAGFFTPESKVAYRVTWAFKDANGNLIEGTPSSRLVLVNYSPTESGTTELTFAIPSDIGTTDTQFFYRIYRTAVIQASDQVGLDDIDPGEEMNLVIEDFPTSGELTARTITIEDITPETFRTGGALLYTNPVSGEGILQSNDPPPIAKDLALFQNTLFYANTQTAQQLDLALLGVTNLISGTSSITITQGATVNTYTFVGTPEITEYTFDTKANTTDGGYFLINSASNLRKYVIWFQKQGAAETTEFTFGTVASITNGSYFFLNSANDVNQFFVWFDKTGSTPVPSGPDTIGKTPLRVSLLSLTSANEVATAVANILPDTIFGVTINNAIISVENTANGTTTNAAAGAVAPGGAFAISIITAGSDDTVAPDAADTVGRISVPVDIREAITDDEVAIAVNNVLIDIIDFTPSILANVVTVDTADNGNTDDSVDGITPVGGAFAINILQQGTGEDQAALEVLLSGLVSPSQAIDETARSLVNIINNNPLEVVDAFYLSGPDDVPGLIFFRARDIDSPEFSITANSTLTGEQFNPTLPTSGTSVISTFENEPNALYYSKFQQPEAVPIVNKFSVGPKDKAILRILPLRDSLFVLKEDGIYRVTGQAGAFILDPFDNSAILLAPDSAVVLNNQIYMLSSQGIVTVSDTGVSVISRPIEGILDRITSSNFDFKPNTFGVSYESDRAYLLWTVTNTIDEVPTQCFRFNTFTSSWTRFPISKTCGVIKFDDDKLYVGAGDINFIERERKDFLRTDYADRQYDLDILTVADNVVTMSSIQDVEVGDVLVQTQYLTMYQFNQLLKKLDLDPNPTDSDYFAVLGVEAGVSFRNVINALALKLDNDAGINNNTFSSSIGSGTTFVDFQDDFNIIVNLLNTASGVKNINFQESEGTQLFEGIVNEKIRVGNKVILPYSDYLIAGVTTLMRGIPADVIWAPQTFGDPSLLKQVREGTYLFEDTVFYQARVGFASDMSPDFEFIDFHETGLGDWGSFVWDEQNWGGGGSQVPLRTYIPRFKQRCRFIKPRFQHNIGREKFALFGLSLTLRAIGERAYRS